MALRPGDVRLRSGAIVHLGVARAGQPDLSSARRQRLVERHRTDRRCRLAGDGHGGPGRDRRDEDDLRGMGAAQTPAARPDHRAGKQRRSSSPIQRPPSCPKVTRSSGSRSTVGPIPWAEIEGKLWGRRVAHRMSPTDGEARLWAALVFGSHLLHDLTEPEMMVLARHGRAVSPVTSYLAIEPGVRPSTEGIERRRAHAPDVFAASANVRGEPEPPRIDRQRFLEDELVRAWRTADASGARRAWFSRPRSPRSSTSPPSPSPEPMRSCRAAWKKRRGRSTYRANSISRGPAGPSSFRRRLTRSPDHRVGRDSSPGR